MQKKIIFSTKYAKFLALSFFLFLTTISTYGSPFSALRDNNAEMAKKFIIEPTQKAIAYAMLNDKNRIVLGPHSPKIKQIIQKFKTLGLPTKFVSESFRNLNGIIFINMLKNKYVKSASAAYFPNLNVIALNLKNYTTKNRIIIDDWEISQFQLLYHELWHKYFHSILPKKNPRLYRKILRWSKMIYGHLEKKKYRIEAIDEAIANLIENSIRPFLYFKKHFKKAQRDRATTGDHNRYYKSIKLYQKLYNQTLKSCGTGYYQKWVSSFILLKRRKVTVYLNSIRLANRQKQTILREVMENRIPFRFHPKMYD